VAATTTNGRWNVKHPPSILRAYLPQSFSVLVTPDRMAHGCLRKILVHGARAVVLRSKREPQSLLQALTFSPCCCTLGKLL
jgi:hypothetical protein